MGIIYQVIAECAHATISTPYGRVVQLMYKGALIPADAPELPRLLGMGFVAKLGNDENTTGGVDATGTPSGAYTIRVPASVTSTPVTVVTDATGKGTGNVAGAADTESDGARAAAKAKLPTDGSAPHPNAGQPVWVEYHVARGSRYEDVVNADKAELVDLAKQQA